MREIVEVDAQGAIQLPRALLDAVKPHTRFMLEVQGETIILRPITPFWLTATPQERAEAARQWAGLERPSAPPIPDEALHRDRLYD